MAEAKKPEKGAPRQREVLAALVTAKFDDGQIRYFHKGAVLPDGVTAESLAHLVDLGFVSK